MNTGYSFTEGVQEKILAIMWMDKENYPTYKTCIKPRYFKKAVHNDICRIISDYWEEYKKPPSLEILIEEINDLVTKSPTKAKLEEDYVDAITNMSSYDMHDLEYLKDKIVSFGRKQAMIEAVVEGAEIVEKGGDYVKIESLVKDAIRVGEDVANIGTSIFEGIEERFESYVNDEDVIERIPTGSPALDRRMKGGLGRTEMGVVIAPPGRGKALHPGTPVLTPKGYVPIKDLSIGDKVISVDGKPCTVTNKFYHKNKHMYKVKFLDGSEVICCDEHLWSVQTRDDRGNKKKTGIYRVLQLKDMMHNIKVENKTRCNYSIPTVEPVEFETDTKISIDPWLLGAFIGDGCSTSGNFKFSNSESDILQKFIDRLPNGNTLRKDNSSKCDYNIVSTAKLGRYQKTEFREMLEECGLFGKLSYDKFIPREYLMSSMSDRLELLRGLLDTDGYVKGKHSMSFSTSSKQLRDDFVFLAQSLGCSTSCTEGMGEYSKMVDGEKVYTKTRMWYEVVVQAFSGLNIVSSDKHLKKFSSLETKRTRFIEEVEYVGDGEAICITVDHPSELFVINDMIVTHNTTWMINAGAEAVLNGYNVIHYSFENNEKQIIRNYDLRLLEKDMDYVKSNSTKSIKALMNIQKFKKGQLIVKKYPTKSATVNTLRAHLNQLEVVKGFKPDVLIIDYGALMRATSGHKEKRDNLEAVYEEIRALADEYNCALWTAAQGNRASLSKKVVTMNDLAECFAIANIADFMIALCQTKKEKSKGIMRYFIAKQRDSEDHLTFIGKVLYNIKKMLVDKEVDYLDDKDDEDDDEDWEDDASSS